MKLDRQTLLVNAIGLLIIFGILLLSSRYIVLKSFRALETADVRRNLQQIVATITSDLETLDATTQDYATWDDLYRFMGGENPPFVATNLGETSLAKIRIDLVVLARPDGTVVVSKALDGTTARPRPLPQDLAPYLTASSPLVHPQGERGTAKGILPLATPLLVAARPVLTSAGKGPSRGTLIMGRFLDATEVTRLSQRTNTPLTISRADLKNLQSAPFKGSAPFSLANPYHLHRPSDSLITGYALLPDIHQQPGAVVQASIDRQIYRQGVKTIRYFLAWCLIIALGGSFAVYSIMRRYALSRPTDEREHLFAAALSQSLTPIAILGTDCRTIVQSNAALSVLLGWPPEQLSGTMLREYLGESRAGFELCCQEAYRDQALCLCEVDLPRAAGSSPATLIAAINAVGVNDEQYLCVELRESEHAADSASPS